MTELNDRFNGGLAWISGGFFVFRYKFKFSVRAELQIQLSGGVFI
jgi:hypothetical protein